MANRFTYSAFNVNYTATVAVIIIIIIMYEIKKYDKLTSFTLTAATSVSRTRTRDFGILNITTCYATEITFYDRTVGSLA